MKKNSTITIGLILLAIIIGIIFLGSRKKENSSEEPVSNETETVVRALVTDFGTKLKNVSVLSPSSTLKTQMQAQYGQYVSPELLAEWQADSTQALGRNVSSPWPDRIDIISLQKENDSSYTINGNVIEVTSADLSKAAAVYPITLTIEHRGTMWLITKATKGSQSELPKSITVSGAWECLPHKDTSGPQTLECAFGLKEDKTGSHYALDFQSIQMNDINFPTGSRMEVEGTLVPAEALNSNMWQKYPIKGIIKVSKVRKI